MNKIQLTLLLHVNSRFYIFIRSFPSFRNNYKNLSIKFHPHNIVLKDSQLCYL